MLPMKVHTLTDVGVEEPICFNQTCVCDERIRTLIPVSTFRAVGDSSSAALIAFIIRKFAALIVCAVPYTT